MNIEFKHQVILAKKRLIQMHREANAGHVGGNLSCIDAMLVLHHLVMSPEDRLVLSKGHSAGALYVALWSLGKLSDADLKTFCKDNTKLPGHPSGAGIPSLMFPTGSLGHGPSLAAGLALAAKRQGSGRHVFCLCSDGEWQEGSCWEAIIFSVHHRLDNLTIIIDQNGLQGFGTTEEVVSCGNLRRRFEGFGVSVSEGDGHDIEEIHSLLKNKVVNLPNIVLLNTRKGNGTLYENKMESHYLPLTDENYAHTIQKLKEKEAM